MLRSLRNGDARRYDGFADWYDANIGPFAEPAGRELLELLGHGPGRLLELACGGGINLRRLTDAGWSVTGVDRSADQLRLAHHRAPAGVELIQADATALPFADSSFDAIACALLHTDVAPELHPGYRNTAWTTEGFSDGIRRRAGARHVPLAELLNAFPYAGLHIDQVTEAADEDFPARIGILAER